MTDEPNRLHVDAAFRQKITHLISTESRADLVHGLRLAAPRDVAVIDFADPAPAESRNTQITRLLLAAPRGVAIVDLLRIGKYAELVEYAAANDIDLEDAVGDLISAGLQANQTERPR